MTGPVILREACQGDDAEICALLRRVEMPGGIAIAGACDPSFFASLEVEGDRCRVLVVECGDKIVGVGVMASRQAYLNGTPSRVGYISSLRIEAPYRKSLVFVRGLKQFRNWHEDDPAGDLYLGSILEGNAYAHQLFTSGRAGLPIAHAVCRYHVLAIPLTPRHAPQLPAGVEIVRGDTLGAVALADCLARFGSQRQFYPVYAEADLLADDGILRGLRPEDFLAVLANGAMQGVMALWDQSSFRRMMVARLSPAMAGLRILVTPLARALGLAPLPGPGDAMRTLTAACVAVDPARPDLFALLLAQTLHEAGKSSRQFLLLGLAENDPWLAVARRHLHFPMVSRIYAWKWGDGDKEVAALDGRIPYIELGGL